MKLTDFTLDPTVVNAIDDLRNSFKDKDFIISDVIDDQGHQYVDLVQEGGGVLGIALLGYTYVLEQMGIRFLNIGGTSAGAINSVLLASCDKPEAEKTTKLLEILANKNLFDFVDGDKDAKAIVELLLKDKINMFRLLFSGIKVIDNFKQDMGLNPGDSFHQWLVDVMADFGIHDIAELQKRMNELPDSIRFREEKIDPLTNEPVKIASRLAIIAAEVNTETKVEFPRMRSLFYKDVDKAHPADFVRASMSVPLFFKPFEITDLPRSEKSIIDWKRIAEHRGGAPSRAIMVDGGIMSNFPIDVFHRSSGMPTRPTFGVKLGLERVKNNDINNIGALIYGCFDAARNLRDFEFIFKNPDYKNLVTFIDIKDHNWLDFEVKDEVKLDLFKQGVIAGKRFIEDFNWTQYKEVRSSIRSTVYSPRSLRVVFSNLKKIVGKNNQEIDDHELRSLEKRILTLGRKINLKVLWIDDNPQHVKEEIELFEELGIKAIIVKSSEEAKEVLESKGKEINFIISDIKRGKDPRAGMDFTTWVSNVYPQFNNKVLFYIVDLDESLGVPGHAFGITDSCLELIHLLLDLTQRELR